MSAAPLLQALQARAPALSQQVIARMYEDPFWLERFGERGRRMAEQDAQHHVEYLVQALSADDADILRNYARWLQSVLVTRGMCTRHLAENFQRLEQAIGEQVADSSLALDFLSAARHALLYPSGPARELQDRAQSLAELAADALSSAHPEWASWRSREVLRTDLLTHLAYLSDAIALGRTELFVGHAVWFGGFLKQRRSPPLQLPESLAWFARALSNDAHASAELRERSTQALLAAQARLVEGSEGSPEPNVVRTGSPP